jgi:formylglycine-generating enzyme required for sulfatase activity
MSRTVFEAVQCWLNPAGVILPMLLLGCEPVPPPASPTDSGSTDGGSVDAGTSDSAVNDDTGGGTGDGAPFVPCTTDAGKSDTVAVAAGNFIIGCNASVDTDCLADEKPMHTVTLSAFAIERTEVTQNQYSTCVAAGACSPPSCGWVCAEGDHPAGCIEWAQAKAYCAWVAGRLPTEAEWEAAARGADGRKYPWGNEEPDCTRVAMAGCSTSSDPVGQHPTGASPFGALDMAGNVVEMVADWYDSSYYQVSPTVDPTGPASGTRYGGRGGGYLSVAVWQRTSARDVYDLTDSAKSLGFRCAR